MLFRSASMLVFAVLVAASANAQEPIHFEGDVPEGPDTFFFLDFDVPEGVQEIEVVHTHIPEQTGNVLDWGLDDPNGSRGSGGSNQENTIVGVDAASRNYIPGSIPAGTWRVTIGKARLVEGEPAGYSVDVFLRTTPTLDPQPRAPYQDPGVLREGPAWYAGDFHVHTRESGDTRSSLTLDEAVTFAENEGLDFVMLSEHNTNSGFTLYDDVASRHPGFLIFPGQEFTTYKGHANALGALENVTYTVDTDGYTIEDAIEAFHAQGALFSINHPTIPLPDCRGCSWDFETDPTIIDCVEVQTAIIRAIFFWEDMIENGSHATAIGGSDDHRAGQDLGAVDRPIGTPTTLVYAEDLSVDAILDGVRSGQTVVKLTGPDGPMIEWSITGERDGYTVFADSPTLRAVVTGGDGFGLRLIKNGEIMETVSIDGDPFEYQTTVTAPETGEDRYRYELVDRSEPLTLTSYVYLQKGNEPPTDGGMPDGGSGNGGSGAGGSSGSGGSGCAVQAVGAPAETTAFLWAVFLVFALLRGRARRGA